MIQLQGSQCRKANSLEETVGYLIRAFADGDIVLRYVHVYVHVDTSLCYAQYISVIVYLVNPHSPIYKLVDPYIAL